MTRGRALASAAAGTLLLALVALIQAAAGRAPFADVDAAVAAEVAETRDRTLLTAARAVTHLGDWGAAAVLVSAAALAALVLAPARLRWPTVAMLVAANAIGLVLGALSPSRYAVSPAAGSVLGDVPSNHAVLGASLGAAVALIVVDRPRRVRRAAAALGVLLALLLAAGVLLTQTHLLTDVLDAWALTGGVALLALAAPAVSPAPRAPRPASA